MADPVRPLVLISGAEALGGVAVLAADVVAAVRGTEGLAGGGSGLALAGIVLWLLIAAALVGIWLGLYRRRALARTPFLLVQAFVLVVVPLFWGSDLWVYRVLAALLAVAAVGGLVLGLRPAVRAHLS